MNISYSKKLQREIFYSLDEHQIISIFDISEIKLIRSYIADLRSADTLADAPISFEKYDKKSIVIKFNNIIIYCSIISTISNPTPKQIRRLKINKIVRNDLQISDQKKI